MWVLAIANFAAPSNDTMASILTIISFLFYQLEPIIIINILSFFFESPSSQAARVLGWLEYKYFRACSQAPGLCPIVHRKCMGYVIVYSSGGPPAESLVRMVSVHQRILNGQTQTAKLYVAVDGARQPTETLTLAFSGGICNC